LCKRQATAEVDQRPAVETGQLAAPQTLRRGRSQVACVESTSWTQGLGGRKLVEQPVRPRAKRGEGAPLDLQRPQGGSTPQNTLERTLQLLVSCTTPQKAVQLREVETAAKAALSHTDVEAAQTVRERDTERLQGAALFQKLVESFEGLTLHPGCAARLKRRSVWQRRGHR